MKSVAMSTTSWLVRGAGRWDGAGICIREPWHASRVQPAFWKVHKTTIYGRLICGSGLDQGVATIVLRGFARKVAEEPRYSNNLSKNWIPLEIASYDKSKCVE